MTIVVDVSSSFGRLIRRTCRHRALAAGVATAFGASLLLVSGPTTAHAAPASQLLRYPYLTDDSGTHATVELATNQQTPPVKLTYGLAPNCSGGSASASGSPITVNGVQEYQFKLRMTGLGSPGASYCYGITQSGTNLLGTDPNPTFKSALAAGDTTQFKFAVIGDWGNNDGGFNNPQLATLMSSIHNSGASLAFSTGDNSYPSGTQTNYGDYRQQGTNISNVFAQQYWGQNGATIPMFADVGDHGFTTPATHFLNWDATGTAADSGGKYVSETYAGKDGTTSASYPSIWYAFNWGQARFYVLTAVWGKTNVGTGNQYQNDFDYHWAASQPEITWLTNDLQSTSGGANPNIKAKFAFLYFPFHADNSSEPSDTLLDGAGSLEGLLANNNVTAAFSGHAHIYERNLPQIGSMPTYVTGGGGGDLEPVTGCSAFDAYAVGWSPTNSVGSKCGASTPVPQSQDEVNEYILVTVSGDTVTVAPTNAKNGGTPFDVQTYPIGAPSGNATHFSITAPSPVSAGTQFNVTLTALTSTGATDTAYSGTKSLTFSGLARSPNGTSPTYATSATFSNGVATNVPITAVDAQTATLSVTDGAISGSSSPITVNPISAVSFTLSSPGPRTVGVPFSETATAVDPFGNTATSYTGPTSGPRQGPSSGPPAFVQEAGAGESAAASTLRTNITTSAGDLLVTCLSMYTGATVSTTSISDSGGNVWHPMPVGNPMFVSGHSSRGELWYTLSNGGDSWVQANFTGSISVAMSVLEFSGVTAVDTSAGAAGAGSSASSGATASLSSTGELAVGFAGTHGTNNAISSTASGYTTTTQHNSNVSSALVSVLSAYKLNAGTSPETYTATLGGSYWAAGVVAFKSGGSGGGGGTLTWSGLSPSPNSTSPGYPATTTFNAGVAQVSLTAFDAQTTSLTLSDGTISGRSTSFTVTPGVPSSFRLSPPNPSQPTAGSSFTETITAIDAYGNTSPSYVPPATGSGTTGSISFVQEVGATESSIANTISTSIASAGGDLLVAAVGMFTGGSVSVSSVSDSAGNTWRPMPSGAIFSAGHNSRAELWYSITTAPVSSVRVNFSASVNAALSVLEFSGVASVDRSAGASNVGTSASSGPTGTLSGTGELSVGFVSVHSSTSAITSPAPGYVTVTQRTSPTSNASVSVQPAYKLSAGTAPETYSATTPNQYWAAGVITFTPKTGTGTGSALRFSGLANAPNGTAPVYPSTTPTFNNGVGTATLTAFDAQTTTLSVTDGTLNGSLSNLSIAPASATHFSLANPGNQNSGIAFNEAVTAQDAYNNVATGYAGARALSWSGPGNTSTNNPSYPSTVTFVAGIGTAVGITLYKAETTALTVTQAGLTGTSPSFSVGFGTPRFLLSDPGTQTAGQQFSETVTAVDSAGNVITSYTGQHTLTWSGPANSPGGQSFSAPAAVTFSAGVGSALITVVAAEPTTLSATDGSSSGTSASFAVNPGSAAALAVASPGGATAGSPFTETVTANDAFGNVATGYSAAIALSGPDAAPDTTAPSFSFVSRSAGVTTWTVTLYDAEVTSIHAADGSLSGDSSSFTVQPAGTAELALTLPSTSPLGRPVQAVATALDAWGNQTPDGSVLSVSSSDSSCSCPSSVTLSNGQVTFSVTFNTLNLPGQHTTLSVAEGSTGPTASATTTVTIAGGAAQFRAG